MNLRSPFWGLKVNKAGDAFAAEKTSNFGPRKAGLKIIFRLQEENLYVKVSPSLQHQPAVARFMAVLGLNDQLAFHWLKISDLT